MQHQTLWGRREVATTYPSLEGDLSASVVVIGGGITGLSTARVLQERGHQVVVLEMHRVGLGTTGHSSGHLDATVDNGLEQVEKSFGSDVAAQTVAANRRALDRAERWTHEHGIACDLVRVPGYLYAENEDEVADVRKQAEAYVKAGELVERPGTFPLPFSIQATVRLPGQIRFDPLDFTRGVARVVAQQGGRVFEQTRVRRVHDHRDGVTIETTTGKIEAKQLVVATHGPLFGMMSMQTRAHPHQSYVIAVRVRDVVEDALYWDQMEPYHYTRVLRSDDPKLLLIGGADHRTGDENDTESCFDDLIAYAKERFDVEAIEGKWSHEYFEPADELPYVGKLPGRHNTYIATGFSGDGLSWGLVTAEVVADAIEGKDNPIAEAITPARIKPIASALEMASAGLTIAKHAIGDHLAFADVDSLEEIPTGEGRLIRLGLKRLAVYRDDGGALHAMSPVCRHAGCVVQWNGAAKTWDCPCHGGRYDAYGHVIAAPPTDDLERQDL